MISIDWEADAAESEELNDAQKGRKDDAGKPDWSLLPWEALEEVVRVLTYGKEKYGAYNWQHVNDWDSRYPAAAMRHFAADRMGEARDASGCLHLAHSIASLLFTLSLQMDEDRTPERP